MTTTALKKILNAHREWAAGNGGERANLRSADLSGADLSGADLRSANLSGANLSGANLRSADLRSANLRSADLSGADLRSAYLSGADLRSANLSGADLRSAYLDGANLRSANLRSADLSGADLRSADLSGADLRSADLSGADLRSANLDGANLRGADLDDKTTWPAFFICPETGSFRAWKKLKGGIIAELEIPAKAKRVCTPTGRKCRAEFVKVIALHGTTEAEGVDTYAGKTKYIVGKITRPDSFDDSFLVECTHGIHFLMTRKEAEEHE
jgi:hypothetical protein